ncbi:hypothetical protein [Candidatus Electronema sp. TJ]|uniref:hypothetical protein n=1 Tax=Candidatus Electronema sp. TJ TaxID=3401573 RepID=UPI003AA97D5A
MLRACRWHFSLLSLVLFGIASLHSGQTDAAEVYRDSPLIHVEVTLLILLFILFVAQLIGALFLVLEKRRGELWKAAADLLIGLILTSLAFAADGPTLLR